MKNGETIKPEINNISNFSIMQQEMEILQKIYTEWSFRPLSIIGCAQPHEEICRFAAAVGAILTADFICREYNIIVGTGGNSV